MSKDSNSKYFAPKYVPDWVQWGDLLMLLLTGLIMALALFNHGLVLYGNLRGASFLICGIMGLWSAVGYLQGRFDGQEMMITRSAIILFFATVLCFGFQLIPLPSSVSVSLTPPIKASFEQLASLGGTSPETLPLSQSPVKAMLSWHQMIASLCFFSCIGMIAQKRKNAHRLMILILIVGFIEVGISYYRILTGSMARVSGSLINPNHHAVLVLVGLIVGLGLFLRWQRDRYASVFAFMRGTNPGILLVLLFLVMIISWAGSLSRASLILGILAMTFLFIWELKMNGTMIQDERNSRFFRIMKWLPIFISAIIVSAILVSPILQATAFVDRIEERIESQDSALIDFGRIEMSRATLEALAESPISGLGLAGTNHGINRFERTDSTRKAVWSHNDYVQFIAEIGIPMALILLILAIFLFRRLRGYCTMFQATFPTEQRDLYRYGGCAFVVVMAHAMLDFHLRIPLIGFVTLILLALCITPGLGFYAAARAARRQH